LTELSLTLERIRDHVEGMRAQRWSPGELDAHLRGLHGVADAALRRPAGERIPFPLPRLEPRRPGLTTWLRDRIAVLGVERAR
jgi:hypothetical protein